VEKVASYIIYACAFLIHQPKVHLKRKLQNLPEESFRGFAVEILVKNKAIWTTVFTPQVWKGS
jgi:hypothetical protein